MRRIFWGFCRNWFLMSPIHYLSGRSDFGFEFAEISVFELLPAISDAGSRRLSVLVIRGVADSPYRWVDSPHHWYAESATPWLNDTGFGYWIFSKENSLYQWYGESLTPLIIESPTPRITERRVDNPAYHRYGESTTPRIVESGSRRLCVLVIQGVAIRKKFV